MFRKKRDRSNEERRLKNVCHLLTQLDSLRAFKRVNLTPIEESFHEINRTKLWEEIQPDLEKIVYFPQTLPLAFRLMQVGAVLRRLFPICFFSVVLVILDKAGIIRLPASPIAALLFLFAPIVILIGFVCVDLFIKRIIIKYERTHPRMQSKQKERIRKIIQTLTEDLREEIRNLGKNPAQVQMELYFDDYEGIKIVRELRRRFFRLKYPIYLGVPAMSEKTSSSELS